MRAFFLTVVCSSAILGQAALAQTGTASAPPASAQSAAPSSASPATAAPSQAAAAAAATAPAAVPQESASSSVNLDEIVCRNQPPATGTRLGGGRECHSVREWNQREREAQDATRREQATGMVHPGG